MPFGTGTGSVVTSWGEGAGLTPFALLLVAAMVGAASITYLAGSLEFTLRHREIARMGGLAARTPGIFGWTLATAFILAGAPPFASFAGRLLVLSESPGVAVSVLLASSWLLAIACALVVIHRVFLGIPRVDAEPIELTGRERLVLVLLCMTAMAASVSPMTLLKGEPAEGRGANLTGLTVPR
jgi:formate hydrogenlyase subunit 3/multisubunit Na+/H+ antiporter MnhD subunit